MANGRLKGCTFRTIPACLGAFLALTAGLASQQDDAVRRALPDIKQLLNECGRIGSRLRFSDYKKFRVETVAATLKKWDWALMRLTRFCGLRFKVRW